SILYIQIVHSFPTRRSSDLNWTSKFMISQLYLSDFVFNELNILDIEVCDYNDIDYKQEEIEECIIKWNKDRDFVFEEFEKNNKRSEEHTSELQSRFDLVCSL